MTTYRVLVRKDYSEESIWRDALGYSEPLHVWSTDGAIDAPTRIPNGSHCQTKVDNYSFRD